MSSTSRSIVTVVIALVTGAVHANNEYTKTVTDGVAEVIGTINDPVIYDTLSGTGIDKIKFTRSGSFGAVKLRSSSGNSHTGGTISDGVMVKVQNRNVLGTGPIWLLNKWSALYVDWSTAEVDVPNKVYFDQIESYVAGQDSYGLALHNIGVTEGNSTKVVTIGRTGTGTANLRLALDGASNDPIGYFCLRGNLALTVDGGTLRAAAGAASRDLFSVYDNNATPNITIRNNLLTLDTAAGAPVSFGGIAPTFSKSRTVEQKVEEYKPANWSFEENGSWTFTNGELSSGSGIYSNNGSFDQSGLYATTNGTHFLMLRQGSTATQTINVPTTGRWRVAFERGCRDATSTWMKYSISIDGSVVTEFPILKDGVDDYHFTPLTTAFVNLVAGSHTLTISTEAIAGDGNKYKSMNFDAVRLERFETVTPGFELAKTGAGTFIANDFTAEELNISVQEGRFVAKDSTLSYANVAVGAGGDFRIDGLAAPGATINVANGGTVSFGSVDDFIDNGSFETAVTESYGFQWGSSCKWNLQPTSEPRPGILHVGCALTSDPVPDGSQALYLKGNTSAAQTFTVPETGSYLLSFAQSPRNNYNSWQLGLSVTIDDEEVVSNAGRDAYYGYTVTTNLLVLTQGSHTIKFICSPGASTHTDYSMMFVDNVSVVPYPSAANSLGSTRLQLVTGSVVRIGGGVAGKVEIGSVTVNGNPVNGGVSALRSAGVVVEGTGRIQCGNPSGLIMIFR